MKKLFIVTAAIAMSVAANASTVTWGANSASAIDAGKITSGTFYLIYAANPSAVDMSKLATLDTFTVSSVISTAGLTSTFDTFDYSSTTYYKKNTAITPTSTGVSAGNGLTIYEVLISDDGEYLAYGGPSTMNLAAAAGMNQSKSMGTFTYVPKYSGGGGDAAPEPTSGLLLALGGAMLALRRRRA